MLKYIDEKHLSSITEDAFEFFKHESYSEFCSSRGKFGSFGIGVNGLGNYVVRVEKLKLTYSTALEAIEKYKSLFVK